MPAFPEPIDLSVVVPVLNEAEELPRLMETLNKQHGIRFEVLFCDGGSTDNTLPVIEALSSRAAFPCRVLQTAKGRAVQMNAGAKAAHCETLLFFHVDSFFHSSRVLADAFRYFQNTVQSAFSHRIAGHFPLRFARSSSEPSFAISYYEMKTYLGRPYSIHGDQGFLIKKRFFIELDCFDESLPFLEDARIAAKVRKIGRWVLLPGEIVTSARRFEKEGLFARQVLNAFILNFLHNGMDKYLAQMPVLYKAQSRTDRLKLLPFLDSALQIMKSKPLKKRLHDWYGTGAFVRGQAWQVAFFLDLRKQWLRAGKVSPVKGPFLAGCDRWHDRLTDNFAGRALAALLVWGAVHGLRMYCRFTERS